MAPITAIDNELVGLQQDISLRARWDSFTADIDPKFLLSQKLMDPKAVGGHRLLSKHSSNPIGMNFNQLKMAATIQQQQQQQLPPLVSLSPPRVEETLLQQHRRLDRSKSEPVRSQPASPNDPNRSSSSSRYKTELCRPFGETGFCKYGEKCQFAHGIGELRNMPRHPKYKTELCRTFHTTGLCGYGSRCHFIHNADERRNPSPGDSDEPLTNSPPPMLNGCSFFDDTFQVNEPQQQPMYPFIGLETPPTSPVESLAGDMDSMSLSTSPPRMLSTSPPRMLSSSPPHMLSSPPRMLSTSPPRMLSTSPPRMLSTSPPRMLSTSPPHLSTSPPNNTVHLLSFKDNFRLPIFEALTEVL